MITHDSTPLSPRESQVLELVRDGVRTKDIAARLGIAAATVDTHIRSAMRKLQARTRLEAALRATWVGHGAAVELTVVPGSADLLALLAAGYTVVDAAERLGISRRTAARRLAAARSHLCRGHDRRSRKPERARSPRLT